jgi:hypothetical protein
MIYRDNQGNSRKTDLPQSFETALSASYPVLLGERWALAHCVGFSNTIQWANAG